MRLCIIAAIVAARAVRFVRAGLICTPQTKFMGLGWGSPAQIRGAFGMPTHCATSEKLNDAVHISRTLFLAHDGSVCSILSRAKHRSRPGFRLGDSTCAHEHDPEKACPGLDPEWTPVFGKDHAQTKS
jgi:hypothetical protein